MYYEWIDKNHWASQYKVQKDAQVQAEHCSSSPACVFLNICFKKHYPYMKLGAVVSVKLYNISSKHIVSKIDVVVVPKHL